MVGICGSRVPRVTPSHGTRGRCTGICIVPERCVRMPGARVDWWGAIQFCRSHGTGGLGNKHSCLELFPTRRWSSTLIVRSQGWRVSVGSLVSGQGQCAISLISGGFSSACPFTSFSMDSVWGSRFSTFPLLTKPSIPCLDSLPCLFILFSPVVRRFF